MNMPAIGVTQISSRTNAAARTERVSPNEPSAPLPSMRVPKGARPVADNNDDDELEREWQRRAEETRARIAAADEREWQELLARSKAAAAAAEAAEWAALRAHAAEQTRLAEEREWAELMQRARATAETAPRAVVSSTLPWQMEPKPVAAKPRPNIVVWP